MVSTILVRASESRRLAALASDNRLAQRVARRFVAGEDLAEGIEAARELVTAGRTVSLDLVGEHVSDLADADRAARDYAEAIAAIGAAELAAGISVKPSQLGSTFALDAATEHLRTLASATGRLGVHLTLDMEDHTTTDATVELVEKLHADGHDHVGCAVQSYLHRTPDDVARLNAIGASLRLCKGAYAEPESIAHQSRDAVDRAFADLATALLQHGTYPRFATHDHRLISHVRAEARRLDRDPSSYEFQMLYGVRPELQQRLVDAGEHLCIYVPYGSAWYAYFVRRLAERPANLAFFLRALGR
jgi:proline dehydrogenase